MAASPTAVRSAQELHDAILAHSEHMKEAMLLMIAEGMEDLSDPVLASMVLICRAMADLTGNLEEDQ